MNLILSFITSYSFIVHVNFIFSIIISILSLFMLKHVAQEYKNVRQLKNGRRALNTTLIAMFVTSSADAIRLIFISGFALAGIQNSYVGYLTLDVINVFRVIFLLGFIKVVLMHGKKV